MRNSVVPISSMHLTPMSWTDNPTGLGRFWTLRGCLPFVLFLLALLARLLSLNTFITWDEPMWVYRSIKFLVALLHRNWSGTFLVGHPGVITMICGAVGIAVRRFALGYGAADFAQLSALPSLDPWDVGALRSLAPFLLAAKLPMAVLNAACVVSIYYLAKRLLDVRTALFAALFVALDPFHLALSRVLHIDAPAANFMILSVLSLLIYLRHCSRPYLFFSGALAGLAFLSKSYSLFLAPFAGLLLIIVHLMRQKNLWKSFLPLAFWCLGASLIFFGLWPSMWANPVSTILGVLDTAMGYAAIPQETSNFFLGKAVMNPGPLFYPVVLAFRTTPLVWLGSLAVAAFAIKYVRSRCAHRIAWRQAVASRWFVIIVLLAYVSLFIVFMSFGAKKFDRYMLPAVLALDIVAAEGLTRLIERPTRRAIVALLFVAQGLFVLSYHPYYLAYYNPLLGGSNLAPKVVPVGWGEGIDLAAGYLNRKGDASQLGVATWGIPGFAPLFRGQVQGLTERGLATSDYALVYVSDMQQGSTIVDEFRDRQPEHVVRIHDLDYVWIYPNTENAEVASYLRGLMRPDDALLLDAPSPICRACPAACRVLDSQSEAEVIETLMDIAAGYQRLWYVSYPDSDPYGWLDYQLSTHALLVERRTFLHVTVSCYLLPSRPAFGTNATQSNLNINFNNKVWLDGYSFTEDIVQYRKQLGVTLRWRVDQEMEQNYAVSLRLVDGGGHSWAQADAWLLNSSGLPTSAWKAGEGNERRYLLPIPAAIPPGRYEVKAIVYQTDTLHKVIIMDAKGAVVGTEATLGTISIVSPIVPPTLGDLAIPHTLYYSFDDQVELLGYSLSADQVLPGDILELRLFWRAIRSMPQDYDLFLELRDWAGRALMTVRFPLPNEAHPTSSWKSGELVSAAYDIHVPIAISSGRYWLFVNLIDGDGQPVLEEGCAITAISIEGREHHFAAPQIRFPQQADIAHLAVLLGYDLERVRVEPGGVLHLTLYWRALKSMKTSYTVFTHLLDAEGHVWGQCDSVPCGGACPTTSWLEGEVISDEYDILVGADAPAGEYQVEIGLYDPQTMRRLPVFDDTGRQLSNSRILLGSKIFVEDGGQP